MNSGIVSNKRMKALGLLKEELAIDQFAKLMWGREVAVKFAHHFLDGLVKLGFVEKKEARNTEFYRVTGEGTEALVRAKCGYCEAKRGKYKLASVACRVCDKEHWTCQKCSQRMIIVVGDFPRYRPALKECPKAKG